MAKPSFDPLVQPITGRAPGPSIDASLLTPDVLRASFAAPSSWQPEIHDEQRLRAQAGGALTPAAVLIPLVMHEAGLSLLLTQRTAHLYDHAGQICLPGGRVETFDASVHETALRETEEETGLSRRHIEIIGQLPDYLTNSGYRVTPVVSLVTPPFDLMPDEFEVAEIFEVPLWFLMDPSNHEIRTVPLDPDRRRFLAMPYERHFIWGATAGMLRNFYGFLNSQIESLHNTA